MYFKRPQNYVQVQSIWFPVIDRNPQTFVPNIYKAKEDDFKKAIQRVYSGGDVAAFIEFPTVK